MRIFARAFNASSAAATPSKFAIQIGKGLKGKSVEIFKSIGKVTAGSLDYYISSDQKQGAFVSYNELTGILVVDAATDPNGSSTSAGNPGFVFSDVSKQNDGYLVINASKSPALAGMVVERPLRRIIRFFQSGTDWYEIYSDGWVRQAWRSANTTSQTWTFLIPMRDTNYTPYSSNVNGSGGGFERINILSATQINTSPGNAAQVSSLVVEGYGNAVTVRSFGANPNY
jgi:hypothetical protein